MRLAATPLIGGLIVLLAATPAVPAAGEPPQSPAVVLEATGGVTALPFAVTHPAAMPSAPVTVRLDRLDALTREAVELERTIDDLRAEQTALDSRLAVTSERVQRQRIEAEVAQARLAAARDVYGTRLVEIYKSFESDPITVLLGARTFGDFVSRGDLLTRLLSRHQDLLARALVAAVEAEHQESVLADLRTQDILLRQLLESRMASLSEALRRQKTLVDRLGEESRKVVFAQRRLDAATRSRWRASSIPIGTPIRKLAGSVLPYPFPFLVSEFHPQKYRGTGVRFTAVCSWYGNEFNGRPSASGQIFNQEDFTCASRTLPFGTRLALQRAGRAIVVVVTDRGPYIAGRDLDLSRSAAQALGFSGVEPIEAEFVNVDE